MEKLLQEMEHYAAVHHVPIINERGREVFIDIIKVAKPRCVLEIGTAIGYSALLTACYGAADIKITTLELDEARAAAAQSFIDCSSYKDQIDICLGDASEILMQLPGEYDFVFIDAAKGQYPNYLELVKPLLADCAVIVADNVLFRGYVKSEEKTPRRYKTIVARLRQYIKAVTNDTAFQTTIYEDGDGLAVSYYSRNRQEEIK